MTLDSLEELEKFYKSIQWRKRHPTEVVRVRKDGDVLYVWTEDAA